jgi:hypothetical protein
MFYIVNDQLITMFLARFLFLRWGFTGKTFNLRAHERSGELYKAVEGENTGAESQEGRA